MNEVTIKFPWYVDMIGASIVALILTLSAASTIYGLYLSWNWFRKTDWWCGLKFTLHCCHQKANGAKWFRFFYEWKHIRAFRKWEKEWDQEAGV